MSAQLVCQVCLFCFELGYLAGVVCLLFVGAVWVVLLFRCLLCRVTCGDWVYGVFLL